MIPMSAARNGRSESWGLAAAVMAASACQIARRSAHARMGLEIRRIAPQRSLPPCGWGREQAEFASRAVRSSLHLPQGPAIFLVFKLDAHRLEFIANAIRLLEVLHLACGIAGCHQCIKLNWIQASFTRRILLECPHLSFTRRD